MFDQGNSKSVRVFIAPTPHLQETQSSQLQSQDEIQMESTSQQPQTTKRKREGPFRGPSRALKYKKLRSVLPGKVKVLVPETLGAVVGKNASQFVAECSDWVKELCPLNVKRWNDMPEEVLDELYRRIQTKFSFNEGPHILETLKTQCSNLYRHWRERLKADHYTKCKTLVEAEHACPPQVKIDQWKWLVYSYWSDPKEREKSEKNRATALGKKIHSACGAKSIARIIYEMDVQAEAGNDIETEDMDGDENASTQTNKSDPMYVQLWDKTKRHKNGKFDNDAEVRFMELKALHEEEVNRKGIDNLTIDEAYEKVLGYRSGYARGLGKGHPTLGKDGKRSRAELQSDVRRLLEDNEALRNEMSLLKEDNLRKEVEAKEREERLEKKLQLIMDKLNLYI